MFKEVLQQVVDGTEGAVAALLMGFDGIAIDQYVRDAGLSDVENVGMELSVILKDIRKATQLLSAGDAQEVAILAERMTTVIRILSEDYFMAVTVAPGGNIGKARFLLRVRTAKLVEELM